MRNVGPTETENGIRKTSPEHECYWRNDKESGVPEMWSVREPDFPIRGSINVPQ